MRDLERVLKAAGDPTRTRILKLLGSGGLCVCQVQAVLGLAASTASKHLHILEDAGLVSDRRDGKWIEYTLAADERNAFAQPILALLRGTLAGDPTIRADAERLREIRAIPLTQLCESSRPVALANARRAAGRATELGAQRAAAANRARRSGPPAALLFVCVENSCRSQMAEGFARAMGNRRIVVASAGSRPSGRVNARAIRFMAEKDIDLSSQASKGLDDLPAGVTWDYVVTMGCGDTCPFVPARRRLDWDLPDPKDLDDAGFRAVRDRIEQEVAALIAELIPAALESPPVSETTGRRRPRERNA